MEISSVEIPTREIEAFCSRHHIKKFALFGSVIRDDFTPESDIDVLVEFLPGHIPGYAFFLMESELSSLLGRDVDLLTKNFLSPAIKQSVLDEAVVIYEQA